MILADTSIWIGHLNRNEPKLVQLLESQLVLCHPFVIGELACGNLRERSTVLNALQSIPQATIATHTEGLLFLEHHNLNGCGIGWIDLHLLASTALTGNTQIWTKDKRLASLAAELNLAFVPSTHC